MIIREIRTVPEGPNSEIKEKNMILAWIDQGRLEKKMSYSEGPEGLRGY